ncbi:MAG: hypothetical protein ACKO5E_13660 [bacterium]
MTPAPVISRRSPAFSIILALVVASFGPIHSTKSQDESPKESPAVRLLKSGKVPPERLGTVFSILSRNGNAADLAVLLEKAADPAAFPADIRAKAFETLADAAANRKVVPAGNLEAILKVLPQQGQKTDTALFRSVMRNITAWKLTAAGKPLAELARSNKVADDVRSEAMSGLAQLGGDENLAILSDLSNAKSPLKTRVLALGSLAAVDPAKAAKPAVELMSGDSTPAGADLNRILVGFLNKTSGPETLAKAIESAKIPQDTAKLALRQLYAIGRSDSTLVTALSAAAGIATEVKPLTDTELKALMAEVAEKGNAKRGEEIFRREENSCQKCHALAGAGGQVGPELSDVGSVSPVDYLLNSVVTPELAVKELYQMMTVLTTDGRIVQGIIIDQDDQRLKLKDAEGKEFSLTNAEIEEKKMGGSLMPKGLPNLMTRQEFVDLISFLSELGKPGDYARKTSTTIQRWRVLNNPPEELSAPAPDNQVIQTVLNAPETSWISAYGKFDGNLPMGELLRKITSKPGVIYLQGEVDVQGRGQTRIILPSTEGVTAWVNDQPIRLNQPNPANQAQVKKAQADRIKSQARQLPGQFLIPIGKSKITLRIDLSKYKNDSVRAEFGKVEFGQAILTAVGGK